MQSLKEWLEERNLNRPGIAVAINERVVPREKWEEQMVNSGDRIEVIHAVQGG